LLALRHVTGGGSLIACRTPLRRRLKPHPSTQPGDRGGGNNCEYTGFFYIPGRLARAHIYISHLVRHLGPPHLIRVNRKDGRQRLLGCRLLRRRPVDVHARPRDRPVHHALCDPHQGRGGRGAAAAERGGGRGRRLDRRLASAAGDADASGRADGVRGGVAVPPAGADLAAAVRDPEVVGRGQDQQGLSVELQPDAAWVEPGGLDGGQRPLGRVGQAVLLV